ncbi:MAG: PDZ domain-containing protein [Candidatus Binatia bacterium]|nr:PDZ domain-containing protein [Candidatus Binatia bacterium]
MNRQSQFALSLVVVASLAVGALTFFSEDPAETGGVAEPGTPAAREASARSPAGTVEDYAARIRELADAVEREKEERLSLAAEVASLKNELARVQASGGTRQVAHASASHAAAARDKVDGARARRRGLDVDALVVAGFDEATVREFKEDADQRELDRLYLRDIASREGWLNSQRFREETEALRVDGPSTRDEYGDEFYDWMLYTTGHQNRVEVADVMGGSAAADVGVQPGDYVISYDGQRIFSPSDLRDATVGGEVGELTPVEIIRNGRRTRLMIPRGPLGVRVDLAAAEPQRPG